MTLRKTRTEGERPLLTSAQVAERLKVSLGTVRRLAREGKLPATYVGSQIRFKSTDIDEYQGMRK